MAIRHALVFALIACCTCDEEVGSEPSESPSELEHVLTELGAQPADEAPTGLEWTLPSCRLTYHLDADAQFSTNPSEAGNASSGVFVAGDIVLAAADSSLHVTSSLRGGLVTGSVRSAPSVVPGADEELALTLSPNAREWIRSAQPEGEMLWSQIVHGLTPAGLRMLLPALPEGREGTWDEVIPGRQARVTTKGWVEVQGTTIAMLEATWLHAFGQDLGALPETEIEGETHGRTEYRGHYLVSESGRLLYARVTASGVADMQLGKRAEQAMEYDSHALVELRLVEACDGPTLDRPVRVVSPEQQALERHQQLIEAVLGQDDAAVREILADELQRDDVVSLLFAHGRRFGVWSLCVPQPRNFAATDDDAKTVITCSATLGPRGETMPLRIELVSSDDGLRIAALVGVDTTHPDRTPLMITSERATGSALGWEPTRTAPQLTTGMQDTVTLGSDITLVRSNRRMCALQVIETTDRATKIAMWVGPDFVDRGEVTVARDDERVRCGRLAVRWSYPNHLYLRRWADTSWSFLDVARTGRQDVGEVDASSEALVWHSGAWGDVAYDHSLATRLVEAEEQARRGGR